MMEEITELKLANSLNKMIYLNKLIRQKANSRHTFKISLKDGEDPEIIKWCRGKLDKLDKEIRKLLISLEEIKLVMNKSNSEKEIFQRKIVYMVNRFKDWVQDNYDGSSPFPIESKGNGVTMNFFDILAGQLRIILKTKYVHHYYFTGWLHNYNCNPIIFEKSVSSSKIVDFLDQEISLFLNPEHSFLQIYHLCEFKEIKNRWEKFENS